jgi:hypothetical protein
MKRKLKGFGLGLAIASLLTTVANANLVYNWFPDANNSDSSSGQLEYDSGTGLSTFSFTLNGDTYDIFNGSILILSSDGHLQLIGTSSSSYSSSYPLVTWTSSDEISSLDENEIVVSSDPDYGDWVPEVAVPEPSTIIAGTLLLLPLGASTLRLLRKNRTA